MPSATPSPLRWQSTPLISVAVLAAAVATATGDTHALGSRLDALFAGLVAAGVVVAAVVCPWSLGGATAS